jgi:hypothetical protein
MKPASKGWSRSAPSKGSWPSGTAGKRPSSIGAISALASRASRVSSRVSSVASRSFETMRGRSSTSSTRCSEVALRPRNRLPITGRRLAPGTRWPTEPLPSSSSPPSMMTQPSRTITLVLIDRLAVISPPACEARLVRFDTSCRIARRTVSSMVICGVTRRVRPTSCRSMVWNGWSGMVVSPTVANEPVTKGTFCATTISASWLFRVRIEGVESTRAVLSSASAVRKPAKLSSPRCSAPPTTAPLPNAGARPSAAALSAPASVVRPSRVNCEPPATALFRTAPNCTDRSAKVRTESSNTTASISTWLGRLSRLAMDSMIDWMRSAGAVTISAFDWVSATTVTSDGVTVPSSAGVLAPKLRLMTSASCVASA